jgi:hypothetical protein
MALRLEPAMHRSYRCLNKPLTLCGCDRQLFICGLFVALGLFMTFTSLVVGFTTFFCFASLGWYKAIDPAKMRLIFNAGRFRNQYDAAIRRPRTVLLRD